MMAKPTATSAAATTMIKNTKIWPLPSPLYVENAANKRFTELSINSTHPKMMIAFFLNNTPSTPKENKIELRIIKYSKGTFCINVLVASIIYKSFLPINTAPTIPAKIRIEASSKGNTYSLNNSLPKFLVKPTLTSISSVATPLFKPL